MSKKADWTEVGNVGCRSHRVRDEIGRSGDQASDEHRHDRETHHEKGERYEHQQT